MCRGQPPERRIGAANRPRWKAEGTEAVAVLALSKQAYADACGIVDFSAFARGWTRLGAPGPGRCKQDALE